MRCLNCNSDVNKFWKYIKDGSFQCLSCGKYYKVVETGPVVIGDMTGY